MKKKDYLKKVAETVDESKTYPIKEGLKIAKDLAMKKPDETILVCYNLKVKTNERIRGTVSYQFSFGAEKKVLVFAKGDKAQEAQNAGAAYVGDDDLIAKIKEGWLDFDVCVATPDMMKDVGKLGMVLGRKGLMPNPKTGTVTFDLKAAVAELRKGRTEFRTDKTNIIHIAIGKVSMEAAQVGENLKVLLEEIERKRPSDAKGDFVSSVYLTSTMGPGIHVTHAAKSEKR
jgi:large subunit ribosomal protein L1